MKQLEVGDNITRYDRNGGVTDIGRVSSVTKTQAVVKFSGAYSLKLQRKYYETGLCWAVGASAFNNFQYRISKDGDAQELEKKLLAQKIKAIDWSKLENKTLKAIIQLSKI